MGGKMAGWLKRAPWPRRRASSDYRHLSYFVLRDALGQEGCPVCRLVNEGSRRFLDTLLYESVTDPFVRARIRASRGFCNWHAWMLPNAFSPQSGIAAIHEDVLAQEIEALRHAARPRYGLGWWERVRDRFARDRRRRPARCPACAVSSDSVERNGLHVFIESLAEREFYLAFVENFGLCLPHLRMLEARHPQHPNLPEVRRVQLAKLEAMRADLLEFGRKQDYRFNQEPMGPEQDCWLRSIEMLAGKAHVFGSHRRLFPQEGVPVPGGVAQPAADPQAEAGAEILRLKELLARLEKDNEAIRSRWNETGARLAALTFKLYEADKDRQVLELHLSGTRAGEEMWCGLAESLRHEVAQLKAQLGPGSPVGAAPAPPGADHPTLKKQG
jgi:hypothetical protein